MDKNIKTIAILAAASMTAILPACSSTSGSSTNRTTATETNTITGSSTMTASVGLDSAYNATKDALAELQFFITQDTKDALTGVVKARTADNKNLTVTLNKKSENITEVSVDPGVIERSLGQRVIETIRAKMGG